MIKKIVLVISLILIGAIAYVYLAEKNQGSNLINEFDQTLSPQNVATISLGSLSLDEERQIQMTVRSVFEAQWKYYLEKDERLLDRASVRELYLPEEYQGIKEQIKKELLDNYNDSGTQNQYGYKNYNADDIWRFVQEKIQFSKPRKYRDLNDRIGIMAGFQDRKTNKLDVHYFLFRKNGNNWKIEKEVIPAVSPSELLSKESEIVKELSSARN